MGFRFFKRVKILPGLTLNLSKTGASLSAGVRGAHVTVGSKGVRKTVGLPGTGLFYTEYKKHGGSSEGMNSSKPATTQTPTGDNSAIIIVLLGIIGLSGIFILGLSKLWALLIAACVYFMLSTDKPVKNEAIPDPYNGLDKRFFTASGEPKFTEAEAALIGESAQSLTLLVSSSLTTANESTDYDIRVKNMKIAKDTIVILQKYVQAYPGMKLTSFDEVMHSIDLIEQETQEMGQL
jgi:hypothetical protein